MLMTMYNINIYSENLCLLKSLSIQTMDLSICKVDCCTRDTSTGFLISCNIKQDKHTELANVYEGQNTPEYSSWVFRAELDRDHLKLNLQKAESLLLKNETSTGILEYAASQMILSCKPTTMLILHRWKVSRKI